MLPIIISEMLELMLQNREMRPEILDTTPHTRHLYLSQGRWEVHK